MTQHWCLSAPEIRIGTRNPPIHPSIPVISFPPPIILSLIPRGHAGTQIPQALSISLIPMPLLHATPPATSFMFHPFSLFSLHFPGFPRTCSYVLTRHVVSIREYQESNCLSACLAPHPSQPSPASPTPHRTNQWDILQENSLTWPSHLLGHPNLTNLPDNPIRSKGKERKRENKGNQK